MRDYPSSGLSRRKSPLKRGGRIKRGGKLKPVGQTKAKKQKRYRHYMASAAWEKKRLAAIARAEGQCEYRDGEGFEEMRCPVRTGLEVHHKSYARFRNELPEDLMVLCKDHHALVEVTLYPHRRRSA